MITTIGTATSRSSLIIGTRGSRLAIWQAEWVQARLQEIAPRIDRDASTDQNIR